MVIICSRASPAGNHLDITTFNRFFPSLSYKKEIIIIIVNNGVKESVCINATVTYYVYYYYYYYSTLSSMGITIPSLSINFCVSSFLKFMMASNTYIRYETDIQTQRLIYRYYTCTCNMMLHNLIAAWVYKSTSLFRFLYVTIFGSSQYLVNWV